MARWNEFGKKAAGAKAGQQSPVQIEIARLSGLISEEKKKIEESYSALGKQYVQLHRSDYGEEFAELMETVLNAEKKIQDYQEQILEVKGIRCCTNCGAELAKDAAFCSRCGTPVPKPKTPERPVCTNCGAVLSEGMRFCTTCGTPVTQTQAEAASIPEEPQPRLCARCGVELDDDARFCVNCGTKVEGR